MQKEFSSVVIAKTLLAVLLFAGMGTIIIGGGYIIGEYGKDGGNNQIIKPVNQEENYYDVLEKECDNDKCCLASLKRMRANNHKEADKNGNCPEGFFMDMLKCVTSYQWCVPMEDVGIGIDQKFYCEEDNDCLAICIESGCYNKDYFKNQKDCEALILHSCECVNNKCQRLEEKSDTSDWQTYRDEEFGFEIKYPENWEYLINDPNGKKYPSFRDKKYDGGWEWPGLNIEFGWPIESKIFKLENSKNELIKIYFTNNGKQPIRATCKLYMDSNIIDTCNQILSTFKFIEN